MLQRSGWDEGREREPVRKRSFRNHWNNVFDRSSLGDREKRTKK